ncbi:MAG: hypothetical protein COV29_03090 [Candidatus Yanofskybacteria bacterium CG10_big_fil_rev_8_21_14_0_10_36_16]|uniref:Uncharacterized protein n=1 Tax=Candidatus Yanofskybacteria bacterium CG10_big_fil_rev_8_21_14_0_10_36_16 TaxID=1975096 RepID=A0A2J0Q6X0_9BACT|nr:MAG: hypothetical protein COV29_03090 [Candidatus Yanofskybacteria bacterium CG10_big_fil_rev_8_21_14_0_10_36_16]
MFKNNKKIILWLIVLVVGAGLLVFSMSSGPKEDDNEDLLPDDFEFSPSPQPTLTPTPTPVGGSSNGSGQKFTPATCQLEGKIVFLEDNLYRTEGAKIIYQNIDDVTRQIYWRTTPDDGVIKAGPNLFEQLPIPNGEKEAGVALYGTPTAKQYLLNASVTYGALLSNGAVEIREAECSGGIMVIMP